MIDRPRLALLAALGSLAIGAFAASTSGDAGTDGAGTHSGRLADGALWIAEVPERWNGTLLLYSHGYSRELVPPRSAPDNVRAALLEEGYALAASAYPTAEWAVAEAVPSQVRVLDEFKARFGEPERVIAWGSSMGGLVTSALAERHAGRLDGALTMCASSMGAVPMMNMALDGAIALTTLIPAEPPVGIAGHGNNFEGVARTMSAVAEARKSPEGRARTALAGVLGGIPGWTRPDWPRPAATDYVLQEEEIAASIHWGVFLPRGDQEARAGGSYSWNTGLDYGELLEHSGRSAMVRALYERAGLDLEVDIARLNAAPRVKADASAVDYMMANYTTTGDIGVPVLSVHTIGDGMTSPSLQQSYVDKIRAAGKGDMIAALWIERAGHCTQTAAETQAALAALERKLDTGAWHVDPESLNRESGNGDTRFIEYAATPVPRAAVDGEDYKAADSNWWRPGSGAAFPVQADYENPYGVGRVILDGAAEDTRNHPFFTPLGPNGRACVTCHQPADAMSLSVRTIRKRWAATAGTDPLFAAFDGSNCPTLPQGERASHSLLLDHGLFRIELPWPPKERYGEKIEPDFDIEVVRDPWGCNTGDVYGIHGERKSVSVYRRPRPVANLKYLTAVGFAYDPKQGLPLPLDPDTGEPLSGNIMADNRTVTLAAQMQDAAATHLEMLSPLSPQQRQEIESFILRVYAAQAESNSGVSLTDGVLGGPEVLRDSRPGQLGSIGKAVWSEFEAWEDMSDEVKAGLTGEQIAYRESVARGARIFREKMFLITDSAGINSPIGFGNPVLNSCVFCHNMRQMGNDVAPGQVDLGTTVKPFAEPAPHLPLFRVTCRDDPHPHYGRVIYTTDPGFGLITGRCADVGKITLQSLRGLAAREPYFVNGSAEDLRAVVDYYDRRYNIGYTEQEKQDLVNLMSAL